jgi:tetratricopeptide (TPR) repeat protein
MTRGRAFAAMGDTTRAEQYFAAALDAGGDEHTITRGLLSVCIRDGRYRMAIEYAQRHLTRHPGDDKVRFIIGTLYAALGECNEAEAALRMAAKTNVDNADVHYALAVLLRDQRGDPMHADGEFREYLRISPTGEHAEEARASLLMEVR